MPDPLGPLFDALESINNEMTGFAARLTRVEDAASLKAGSSSSGGGGGGAEASDRTPGAPVVWHRLEAAVREKLWAEFTSWVIRIADTFELTTDQLPRECWWEHGAVVSELTALWTGWESAHASEDDAAAGPYLWHDGFDRAIDRIGRRHLGGCTNGVHEPKSRKMYGTDAAYRKKILEAGPPGVTATKPKAA
ncbi:DUF4913 domain-containing protein [Streptomyces sp. 7N604]|uniref:DUF4913 domain-containing protein n=1 Tax=Streptomyces sp. 7N604 TaxID=3457415 RepID=UPI003FD2A980